MSNGPRDNIPGPVRHDLSDAAAAIRLSHGQVIRRRTEPVVTRPILLIERRRSPQDRRRHLVELTPVGLELLEKTESALAAAENEVLAALDDVQRETLYKLLHQAANGETSCTEDDH